MVTEEEYKSQHFNSYAPSGGKVSYEVTAAEMQRFDINKKLPLMIAKRKLRYEKEKGLKPTPAYDALEDDCQISISSFKKTINGSDKVTRTFLYKFVVGLHMTIDEANDFFTLCGGILRDSDPGDYICKRALEDGDDIFLFIQQYEQFTKMKISR